MQSTWESRGKNGRPKRFVFPMLLIVVGVLFLLNNLGIVPWSVWLALARLWPVLLILLGIELLIGRRTGVLGAAISAILLVAVVAVAAVMTTAGPAPDANPSFQQQTMTVPFAGATSGEITTRFPAGTFTVGALPAKGDSLVEATTSMPNGIQMSRRVTVERGVAQVALSTTGDRALGGLFPIGWPFGPNGSGREMTWNVRLAPGTPLTLRADVGAGQSDFDLTNLMVQQFTVNSGAGQTTIHFPASAGQTVADVHAGAGQLTLIVPPGVAAYIHLPPAAQFSPVQVHVASDRFQQVSDGYQSADYQTATNRVDVTLRLGVGSVDVQ